jgi:hypothetical protein
MSASIPNKEELISAIRRNVPSFLLEQPIWLAYYYKSNKDGTFSKPPVKGYSVKDNEPGKTFEHVIKDGYPGIKINKHNNIVAVDIDDKPAKLGERPFSFDNLSQEFRDFIADKDSYMEWSPSKCGLRILYKIDDKSELPGRANLNSKVHWRRTLCQFRLCYHNWRAYSWLEHCLSYNPRTETLVFEEWLRSYPA